LLGASMIASTCAKHATDNTNHAAIVLMPAPIPTLEEIAKVSQRQECRDQI
jgi:hypothetical protein